MRNIFFKHLKLILVWGIIFSLLAGIVTLFLPKQYSAQSQILIISRDRSGVDPYTQAKSAERIGENLSQVMKTNDFYKRVLSSSYSFDKDAWKKLPERKQRKNWDKDIETSVLFGTGLMSINAYSKSKTDAVNLAAAVAQVITSQGWEYVGGNVVIKYVSSPLTPRLPARPNFVLNILIGFGLGVVLASLWVSKYKKHHLI